MKRKPTCKKYKNDFKRTIVDLYHSGHSVKTLSDEYGVSEFTIYKWIKEFTPLMENLPHQKKSQRFKKRICV
jgi:transposase